MSKKEDVLRMITIKNHALTVVRSAVSGPFHRSKFQHRKNGKPTAYGRGGRFRDAVLVDVRF